MSRFYISRVSGKTEGPFSIEQIDDMFAEQELLPHHMVIAEGAQTWVDAARHPELARRFYAGGASTTPPPLGDFRPGGREYAGFWLRFVAFIVDSVITGIVLTVLFYAMVIPIALLSGGASNANQNQPPSPVFLGGMCGAYLVLLAVWWLYFACFESSRLQGTPGKLMLGIKVTDLSGGRIGFGAASARTFGKILSQIIFYIGYIIAAFTERKQAMHDMLAGTLVVMKR